MKNLKIIHGKKGEKCRISYSYSEGIFGKFLIASTEIGICSVSFIEDENDSLDELKSRFPGCEFVEEKMDIHEKVNQIMYGKEGTHSLTLHIYGTDFQIQVWKELLLIPGGKSSSYSEIAKKIGHPRAVRAVGTAIGANPIAIIIPCHRVFRSDGGMGGYKWGIERKKRINEYERIKREL